MLIKNENPNICGTGGQRVKRQSRFNNGSFVCLESAQSTEVTFSLFVFDNN